MNTYKNNNKQNNTSICRKKSNSVQSQVTRAWVSGLTGYHLLIITNVLHKTNNSAMNRTQTNNTPYIIARHHQLFTVTSLYICSGHLHAIYYLNRLSVTGHRQPNFTLRHPYRFRYRKSLPSINTFGRTQVDPVVISISAMFTNPLCG